MKSGDIIIYNGPTPICLYSTGRSQNHLFDLDDEARIVIFSVDGSAVIELLDSSYQFHVTKGILDKFHKKGS